MLARHDRIPFHTPYLRLDDHHTADDITDTLVLRAPPIALPVRAWDVILAWHTHEEMGYRWATSLLDHGHKPTTKIATGIPQAILAS